MKLFFMTFALGVRFIALPMTKTRSKLFLSKLLQSFRQI